MTPSEDAVIGAQAVRSVSVAVVGTGSIGMRHLGVLRQVAGTQSIAVPRRPERVSHLIASGQLAVRDIREAAECGATRGVIATDTGRHVEDGLEALERGLDLLVEKPLSVNAEEANRLRARAVQLSRKLFVGCTLRFSESLNTVRARLTDIGRVHAVRVECQSYLPDWRPAARYQDSYAARRREGGVLLDLIHEIDYTTWLFGWPDRVQARLRNLGRLGIVEEEMADVTWETPTGAAVSISLDYLTRPPRRRLRASGEHGTIEWDGLTGTVSVALAQAAPTVLRSSQLRDDMFRLQAQAFLEACRNGGADPRLASAEEGVRALAVCDAARLASAHRREESVAYR